MPAFDFAGHTLDLDLGRLRRDGRDIALRPKSFALLAYLVRNAGRVVSKDELMSVLWPDVTVTDDSLTQCLNDVRSSLGPEGPTLIRTLPRRGYLLDESRLRRHLSGQIAAEAVAEPARLSIAVLPFASLGDDPMQAYFAEGMTEDLVGALSRVKEMLILSYPSVPTRNGSKFEPELASVDYTLHGTVRVKASKVRINVQLIDAKGACVWGERYDTEQDGVFAVQDEVTRNIVLSLQIELTQGETARLWEGQTSSQHAWELMVRARNAFHRYTVADNHTARKLLRDAIAIDPNYSGARALLGVSYYWDARYSIGLDRAGCIAAAQEQANLLRQSNPDMGATHTLIAAIAFLNDRHDEAVAAGDRAAALAPSDSRVVGFQAMYHLYAGNDPTAEVLFRSALRLGPRPEAWLFYYLAVARFWQGDADAAIQLMDIHQSMLRDDPHGLSYLISFRRALGQFDEAGQTRAILRDKHPSFSVANLRSSERYRDGGRLEAIVKAFESA